MLRYILFIKINHKPVKTTNETFFDTYCNTTLQFHPVRYRIRKTGLYWMKDSMRVLLNSWSGIQLPHLPTT